MSQSVFIATATTVTMVESWNSCSRHRVTTVRPLRADSLPAMLELMAGMQVARQRNIDEDGEHDAPTLSFSAIEEMQVISSTAASEAMLDGTSAWRAYRDERAAAERADAEAEEAEAARQAAQQEEADRATFERLRPRFENVLGRQDEEAAP